MVKVMRSFFSPRRRSVGIGEFSEGRTVQADADRTDIRKILDRARRGGGAAGFITSKQPFFADISNAPDYMTALNVVARAHQQFELLPAEIRDRFRNDPSLFLDFMADEANAEEIYKLGLRKKPAVVEPPAPVSVRVISDPEPPKSS